MIEKPFLNPRILMSLPTPKKSLINKFSEYFKVVSILLVASLINILCTSDQNICCPHVSFTFTWFYADKWT